MCVQTLPCIIMTVVMIFSFRKCIEYKLGSNAHTLELPLSRDEALKKCSFKYILLCKMTDIEPNMTYLYLYRTPV